MKKIIGILVALGLVLSMTVMATPVSANVTKADVVVHNTNCATDWGTYNITFNVTADLLEGGGTITIDFPDGTDLAKMTKINVIYAATSYAVPATWITKDVASASVTFYSPVHIVAGTDPVVKVNFYTDRTTHGIKNPAVAGTAYTVLVNTSAPVDSTPVESNKYTIAPKLSSYKLVWDSGPTYSGIAKDFVPPFKACGQNVTGAYEFQSGKWMNAFNLTFATDVIGCDTPCVNATVVGHLTKAVPGSVVTLAMNMSGLFNPTVCVPFSVANITLGVNMTVTWNSSIHFDQVGEYEICFNVTCPTAPVCGAPGSEVIARECYTFDVKQWKDAYAIDIYRKWNLISLPLVPFETDIDAILAAYGGKNSEILGIWYYDREPCDASEWEQWPAPGVLTDMEDGKAYWVKVAYNHSDAAKLPGALHGTLWVFGTATPMPPDSPSAYPVCEGWNMAGFRSMVSMDNEDYLWNFKIAPSHLYGMIYGWTAATQTWFTVVPGVANLVPPNGYWIPFQLAGTIYPP